MPIAARRTFRLGFAVALSLAFAYGLGIPLAFAVLLPATPGPPIAFKGLVGLIVVVIITTGVGLLLIPVLKDYPVSAVLIIAAGLVDYSLAAAAVDALVIGIGIAIVCQWIVYPFFPEDPGKASPPQAAAPGAGEAGWIALRATLIVLPPVLMAFSNPSLYIRRS